MGHIATVSLLTIFGVSILSARPPHANLEPAEVPAEVVDMQQTIFNSGGLLEINDSYGDMDIVGWDQPEIEIVVTKSTQKRYAPDALDRAMAALDRIVITTEQRGNDHVLIKTAFPSRTAMRPLQGKSNVHLSYTIHVPRQTRLLVRHDMGELKVHDVTASMLLSNRIGDIVLSLPENERYVIDAKAKIGGVSSEWRPTEEFAGDGAAPHQLQLRVGVGAITVRKSPVSVEALVDDD
jgi:hypothetical protein